MQKIDTNLFEHEDILRGAGLTLQIRMTIAKLQNGTLWIHSPTPLTPEVKADIDALGPIAFLIGSSNGHNRWLIDWQSAYPEAEVYVTRGLPKRVKTLKNYRVLDETKPAPWSADLEQAFVAGAPFFDEFVFLHKESRSLLVTDLVQNWTTMTQKGFSRLIYIFLCLPMGFKGICIAPLLRLGISLKDKDAFNGFLEKLFRWEYDRIVPAHGLIIDDDPMSLMKQLCAPFRKK